MASKKNKTDDFDFDKELDFGDFDFDSDEVSDDRSPTSKIKDSIVEGAKDSLADPNTYANLIRRALPKEYGQTWDEIDTAAGKVKDAYNEAVKDAKPIAKDLAAFINKLVPEQFAGIKEQLKGIEEWGKEREYAHSNEQAQRDANLAMELGNIFKTQSEEQAKLMAQDRAHQRANDALGVIRHKDQMTALNQMTLDIKRLTDYTTTITQAWQKKSLELQYRSYYVQADMLELMRKDSIAFSTRLDAIVKNTGLPDFVKTRGTEYFKEVARNDFIRGAKEKLFGKAKNVFGGLTKNMIESVKDKADSFMSVLSQVAEMGEMLDDGMGGSPAEKLGNITGSMSVEGIANMIGKAIHADLEAARKKGSKNKWVRGIYQGADTLRYLKEDPGAIINEWTGKDHDFTSLIAKNKFIKSFFKDNEKHQEFVEKLSGWLNRGTGSLKDFIADNMPYRSIETRMQTDKLGNLRTPSVFDVQTRKSVNEIIPGLLSRILRGVTVIQRAGIPEYNQGLATMLSKDNTLVSYDFKNNTFKESKEITKDLQKGWMSDSEREAIAGRVDRTFDKLGITGIEGDNRKAVIQALFKAKMAGKAFSPSLLTNPDTYKGVSKENRQAIAKTFKKALGLDLDKRERDSAEFAKRRADIAVGLGHAFETGFDPREFIQNMVNAGQTSNLIESGLARYNKYGSLEMNLEGVLSHMSGGVDILDRKQAEAQAKRQSKLGAKRQGILSHDILASAGKGYSYEDYQKDRAAYKQSGVASKELQSVMDYRSAIAKEKAADRSKALLAKVQARYDAIIDDAAHGRITGVQALEKIKSLENVKLIGGVNRRRIAQQISAARKNISAEQHRKDQELFRVLVKRKDNRRHMVEVLTAGKVLRDHRGVYYSLNGHDMPDPSGGARYVPTVKASIVTDKETGEQMVVGPGGKEVYLSGDIPKVLNTSSSEAIRAALESGMSILDFSTGIGNIDVDIDPAATIGQSDAATAAARRSTIAASVGKRGSLADGMHGPLDPDELESDRNVKTDMKSFSPQAAIEALKNIPIKFWKYKDSADSADGGKQHLGPMAQDVQAALGDSVAPGGKKISIPNMLSATMAAVQGLSEKMESMWSATKDRFRQEGIARATGITSPLGIPDVLGSDYSPDTSKKTLSGRLETIEKLLMVIASNSGYGININMPDFIKRLKLDPELMKSWSSTLKSYTEFDKEELKALMAEAMGGARMRASGVAGWLGDTVESVSGYIGDKASYYGSLAKGKLVDLKDKVWDTVKQPYENMRDLLEGFRDIYVEGTTSPRMTSIKARQGHYVDQATGRVIYKIGDITGAVYDTVEECTVITDDEVSKLYAKPHVGSKLIHIGKVLYRKVVNFKDRIVHSLIPDFIRNTKEKIKSLGNKTLGFIDKPRDIYVVGESEPRLFKVGFMNRSYYLRKSMTVIERPGQIKDEVIDEYGNILLSKEDISKGLVDSEGKTIYTTGEMLIAATGLGAKYLYTKTKAFSDKIAAFARGSLGRAGQWIANKWDKAKAFLDDFQIGVGVMSAEALEELRLIRTILDARLPGGSGPLGDFDKDGMRDGSWQDQYDEAKKKLEGDTGTTSTTTVEKEKEKKSNGLIDFLTDKLTKGLGGIVDGVLGIGKSAISGLASAMGLGGLGGLMGPRGGRVPTTVPTLGDIDPMTGLPIGYGGSGPTGAKTKTPFKSRYANSWFGKTKVGRGLAAGANAVGAWGNRAKTAAIAAKDAVAATRGAQAVAGIGRGVASAGRGVGTAAMWAARGIGNAAGFGLRALPGIGSAAAIGMGVADIAQGNYLSGALSLGMGAATIGSLAPLLANPYVLGAAAIVGAGWLAYKGFKWLTKKRYSELSKLRMLKYGISSKEDEQMLKVYNLEKYCQKRTSSTGDTYVIKVDDQAMADILKILGVDGNNGQQAQGLAAWFENRFKPVYFAHLKALKEIGLAEDVDQIERIKKPVQALKFLSSVKISPSVYNARALPFAGSLESVVSPKLIADTEAKLRSEYESKLSAEDKKKLQEETSDKAKASGAISKAPQEASSDKLNEIMKTKAKVESKSDSPKESIASSVAAPESDKRVVSAMLAARYRAYGVTSLDETKMMALKQLEKIALASMKKNGTQVEWTGSIADDLNAARGYFGVSATDAQQNADWAWWYKERFIPIFVAYLQLKSHYKKTADINVAYSDETNTAEQMYTVVMMLKGMSSCWKVKESPWPKYKINLDPDSLQGNLNYLQSLKKEKAAAEETRAVADTQANKANTQTSIVNASYTPSKIPTRATSSTYSQMETIGSDGLGESEANSANRSIIAQGDLAQIRTRRGVTAWVHRNYRENFQGFINELEATGYNIHTLYGYSNRTIKTPDGRDTGRKSYHAYGAAIDINPQQNPFTKARLITDMPANISEIAARYGIGWGGNWRSSKDPMHFSIAKGEGGAVAIDKNTTKVPVFKDLTKPSDTAQAINLNKGINKDSASIAARSRPSANIALGPTSPADDNRLIKTSYIENNSGSDGIASPIEQKDYTASSGPFTSAMLPNSPDGVGGPMGALLTQIAKGEGTTDDRAKANNFASSYDVVLGYGRYGRPNKPVSQMTLAEVKAYQKELLRNSGGMNSSAVGKYQIVGKTLRGLQEQMKLPDDAVFSPKLQDQMAIRLLNNRGLSKFLAGNLSIEGFQGNLYHEWASIAHPKTHKPKQGKIGQGTTHEQIQAALSGLKGSGYVAPHGMAQFDRGHVPDELGKYQTANASTGQTSYAAPASTVAASSAPAPVAASYRPPSSIATSSSPARAQPEIRNYDKQIQASIDSTVGILTDSLQVQKEILQVLKEIKERASEPRAQYASDNPMTGPGRAVQPMGVSPVSLRSNASLV